MNMYWIRLLMYLSLMLFVLGLSSFIININHLLKMLLSLELILLSVTLIYYENVMLLNDLASEVYILYTMLMAGVETSIGLTLLIQIYNLNGNIKIDD